MLQRFLHIVPKQINVVSFSTKVALTNETPSIKDAVESLTKDAVEASPKELYEWSKTSRRTGLLGMKIGMMPVWDQWNARQNCTVVQIEDNVVIQNKSETVNGYTAVVVGGGICKVKNVNKPTTGQYKVANVAPKRSLQEFRVTPDAMVSIGTALNALHFVPGQMVDVCGTSIGKGFQGTMKLHNFAGQPASHGNSKTHRHLGSTGQCQDPGRVFKGKKMPGRMGNRRVTRDNLKVIKVDPSRNLLYLKGSVPGNKGGMIRITDARKMRKQFTDQHPPPFPTYASTKEDDLCTEMMAPQGDKDPLNIE